MDKLDFRKILVSRLEELGPGYNVAWIAREMAEDVGRSQIYNFFNGTNGIGVEHLERMFVLLGVSKIEPVNWGEKARKGKPQPPPLPPQIPL